TFDGRVWVYDAAHEFLKVRNSGAAGVDETVEVAVVQGSKYFVLVDGSRAPGGAYMLRVEAVDDHADYGHWEFATPIPLDSVHSGSAPGTLESNADSDLFTFEATRTGTAELRLDVASNFDGKLWVYDEQHQFLKVRNERGPGGDETIQVGVEQGVTYFLVVTGWRHPSGGYTLLVEAIDDHADAGAWAAATSIPLDGSGNGARAGVLELARDTDLFRFVAPGAGLVSITLNVVAGFDGWFEIYDSGRNLVEPRRNAKPTGGDETLSFTAAAGEAYFILVGGWRNPNGDYNLLVNA
ncbi:MAG TPA: hypothetical protein VFF69_09505, partial [Phycisphaerales bacterium]|nr:hypothetical protein [Phycisphaerales bacterium]